MEVVMEVIQAEVMEFHHLMVHLKSLLHTVHLDTALDVLSELISVTFNKDTKLLNT